MALEKGNHCVQGEPSVKALGTVCPEARPVKGEGWLAGSGQCADSPAAHYPERREMEPTQAKMETRTQKSLMAVWPLPGKVCGWQEARDPWAKLEKSQLVAYKSAFQTVDAHFPGLETGVEMHIFFCTARKKHLDKFCKYIGTTKGPSCRNSVLGRIVSETERGGQKVVRALNQMACSWDLQSGDELGGTGHLLGGELAGATH